MFNTIVIKRKGIPDLLVIGRYSFAIAMLGFGVMHFVFGEFVSGRAPAWPSSIPGQRIWVYFSGLVMVAAGASVIIRKKEQFFLIASGVMILAWALLRHIPILVADLKWGSELTMAGKALTLCGGIFTIATGFGGGWIDKLRNTGHGNWYIYPGIISLAIFLVICGIEHFIFIDFVKELVPGWIPGNIFWTYFSGVSLIAGGMGLVIRKTSTLAAILIGCMIFTWFIILHIPRAITAEVENASNEWTSVCESLAFSGIAFVLAGKNALSNERQH